MAITTGNRFRVLFSSFCLLTSCPHSQGVKQQNPSPGELLDGAHILETSGLSYKLIFQEIPGLPAPFRLNSYL